MPTYVWCSWFIIYILKNRFSNASRRNACNINNTPKPSDKSVDTATLSILFVFLRRRFSKIFHSRQAYQSDVVRTCMCACVCLYIYVCVLCGKQGIWIVCASQAKQRDSNTAKQRRRRRSATTKNILAICRQRLNAFVRFFLFLLRARRPFKRTYNFRILFCVVVTVVVVGVLNFVFIFYVFCSVLETFVGDFWLSHSYYYYYCYLCCSCCCCGFVKNWQLTLSVTKIDIILVVSLCVCVPVRPFVFVCANYFCKV